MIPGSSVETNNASPMSHGPDIRNPRTCVTCKRRKVKCDRRAPCSNCIKAQTQCRFPPPGRTRQLRRSVRLPEQGQLPELVDQVWALMARVMEQNMNPKLATPGYSPGSDHSPQSQKGSLAGGTGGNSSGAGAAGMDEAMRWRSDRAAGDTTLTPGRPQAQRPTDPTGSAAGRRVLDDEKSQFIQTPFWVSMSESIKEGLHDLLEDHDYDSEDDSPFMPSDVPAEFNHHSFIMGYNSADVDLKRLHPPRSQIYLYWEIFLSNVNPLTKLVHIPTMNKIMIEAVRNLDVLNESTEALVFSIYFAAIISMTPEEVNKNFSAERDYLLRRYRFGVEQALAKAKLFDTTEIVTLQAFVLFLGCVRRIDDTRFVWTLTGLAIRLARALGLHRDGTKLGLSPFDTEMRRRVWWQICLLDSRDSEDHGFALSIADQCFDTEFPLSINDADITPGATKTPVPTTGLSEMTPSLIRFEICHMMRKLYFASPGLSILPRNPAPLNFEERESLVQEASDYLEKQYFQYCVDPDSIDWTVASIGRLSIIKASLHIYRPVTHPATVNNLPQSTKDRLLMASIESVEYCQTPSRVSWLYGTYTQWQPVAYILTELASRPPSPIVERAWRAVAIFRDVGAVSSSRTGMLWQPLRKLMAKAMQKREENKRLSQQEQLGLDMESQYVCPPAPGLSTTPYYATNPQPTNSNHNSNYQIPLNPYAQETGISMQPLYASMDPCFALGHVNLAPHEQQQAQMQQQQPFYHFDDAAMQNLAMSNLDMRDLGEENQDGWDQLGQAYPAQRSVYW